MDFTKFKRLRLAVEALGASQVVANLEKIFLGEGMDIDDPERVVTGASGVYYISPEGVLTKVIVHIVDKSINDRYARKLSQLVNDGLFESDELIKESHKYHLVKCRTIERAEREGWKIKYKMSRRHDGSFFYRYIDGHKIIKRDRQKLLVCKNCLEVVNNLMHEHYTVHVFEPDLFLNEDMVSTQGLPSNGDIADYCEPNVYASDWRTISLKYRQLVKFQCEDPNCPMPDLSDRKFHKFLHTHHVSQDKSNNNYLNLKALCIYCHAKQPNHGQVRHSPAYNEYIQLRRIS